MTANIPLQDALAHIRNLAEEIGARGSCTEGERRGADYAARQLQAMGAQAVQQDRFLAIPSTYWSYGLAFTAAMTGSTLVVVAGGRDALILGVILNGLGVWGMLAESDVRPAWTRSLLPKMPSQNVTGVIAPAADDVQQRVVLCAHIDTHRTPVFYSSERWYSLFSVLIGLCFLSMVVAAVGFGLAAWLGWGWMRWAALLPLSIQLAAAVLCIQADLTPYTPGANDNASGVAACLALAGRLSRQPLQHTAVHVAITGCEETGDWGIRAYLKDHAAELGAQPLFLILDEVALGDVKFLTRDGLLLKHSTHPMALEYARRAYAAQPGLRVTEGPGLAYTDALVVTQHGLPALTICTVPGKDGPASHWHQMSDTVQHISASDLDNTLAFTWEILQQVDQAGGG